MQNSRYCLVIVLWAAVPALVAAQELSGAAGRLAKELDAMDVEHLWLAKHYVNWETGKALKKPVTDNKSHTHCSAFVASTCKRLDIYILRPPEHSATQLANAQFDWLRDEGAKYGWRPVADAFEAQGLANAGKLVVAAYKDPKRPGHIAIVRPSTWDRQMIEREGPEITQAGMENFRSTSLKTGFKHHSAAWRDRQVRFYVHEVKYE
jgi:hypothetical protein